MSLLLMETIQAELSANTNSTQTTLHIVKGASGSLLGYNTAKQLGVLKIINQLKTDETSTHRRSSQELWSSKNMRRHPPAKRISPSAPCSSSILTLIT